MNNRRYFLQSLAIGAGAFLFPSIAVADSQAKRFHIIQTTTLNSWPIVNPAQLCLDHKHNPVLERAYDGLCSLSVNDEDRIIRLVVRRCGLNLVDVQPTQVTVHHWSQQLADLRPFFNEHLLVSPDVQVTLLDRKKEIATNKTGDEFLYGQSIAKYFPVERFVSKWNNRFQKEYDDHLAGPKNNAGLAWDGLELGQIPWCALKSAWQGTQSAPCLNCSGETILVNFGYRQVGLFNRSPNVVSVCPQCRRSFVDDSIKHVAGWIAANLETDFCAVGEVAWGRVAV